MANTNLVIKNRDALSHIDMRILKDDDLREVMEPLPDTSAYKIVRRNRDGESLAIQMGPHNGKPVYMTAEGQAISTGYRMRKVNI